MGQLMQHNVELSCGWGEMTSVTLFSLPCTDISSPVLSYKDFSNYSINIYLYTTVLLNICKNNKIGDRAVVQ